MTRAALLLAAGAWAAAVPAAAADLVLYNGKVFLAPGRYAQALAVEGGRVAAVGDDAKILARARPGTRRIDLAGRAVTPGFHDSHVHFWMGAHQAAAPGAGAGLEAAVRLARTLGVTSISGILEGDGRRELEAWADLHRRGEATLRYWMWGRLEAPAEFLASREKYSSRLPADRFHWSGLKGWVDGDFDGRSAALLEPYSDSTDFRGSMRHSPRDLARLALQGRDLGFSVHLHAIGDRAVRAALGACAVILEGGAATGSTAGAAPCVIEHADLVAEEDRARFAASGVVASMQPSRRVELEGSAYRPQRLGPRHRAVFALRSLQSAGVPLAFGSDWPDRTLDPLAGLAAAVAPRGSSSETGGEALTLEEAVAHYTAGGARAAGAQGELGSLLPGYRADLVVFDRDLFALPPGRVREARVDATIFDGKVVYERVDAR